MFGCLKMKSVTQAFAQIPSKKWHCGASKG